MKSVTTIKNYGSNIEVFFETSDGKDGWKSYYSDEFLNGVESVTQEEFEDELAEEGFDSESIKKIVLDCNINGWLD